jgi:hypothetical protein
MGSPWESPTNLGGPRGVFPRLQTSSMTSSSRGGCRFPLVYRSKMRLDSMRSVARTSTLRRGMCLMVGAPNLGIPRVLPGKTLRAFRIGRGGSAWGSPCLLPLWASQGATPGGQDGGSLEYRPDTAEWTSAVRISFTYRRYRSGHVDSALLRGVAEPPPMNGEAANG